MTTPELQEKKSQTRGAESESSKGTEPRSEGGFDVWLDVKAKLDCLLGKQSSADHNVRVGRVGAGGNGSNNNRAVVQLVLLTFV